MTTETIVFLHVLQFTMFTWAVLFAARFRQQAKLAESIAVGLHGELEEMKNRTADLEVELHETRMQDRVRDYSKVAWEDDLRIGQVSCTVVANGFGGDIQSVEKTDR